MKRPARSRAAAPVITLLLFSWVGCGGSPVPLTYPPSESVDTALLGHWQVETREDEPGDRVRIWAFNPVEYYAEYREAKSGDDGGVTWDDLTRLQMYVSKVDGSRYLNMRCMDCDEDEGWLFARVDVTDSGDLEIALVPDEIYDNLEEDADSDQVVAALRKLLKNRPEPLETGLFRRLD